MKHILTMLLILTLAVGSIAGLLATPVAARIYSVQPTNEDGGPPTDQFTTADPIFAVFRSDVEGGQICVIDDKGAKSHCKTIAAYIGTGWTLIAPGLPPGTYRLRAEDNDPDYSSLSFPFTVAACDLDDPVCSTQRRISDQIVADWKNKAGVSFRSFGEVCSTLEVASSFRKPKIGRGFLFAKKATDDINEETESWGWEAGLVVAGVGYGLGFGVAAGGIATAAYKPFFAVAKELSCGAQQMYADIVADPPDPNFTTVVPPAFTTLPITGDATTDRLALTLDRKRAFGHALLKAYERYLGAVAAGDENAVRLQAQAIADYGQAMVTEMRESATALRAWGAVQAADPDVDNPAITQADLDIAATVFERVRTSGFTADEINQLTAAGLSQNEINQIRGSYNRDLSVARVGVSVQTIADDAAAALDASIPAFTTFSREAAWVADGRAPRTISLSPASASLKVGTTHTATASVTSLRNAPIAGVSVKLSVTGVNPSQTIATTDASGIATFSYSGHNPGIDSLSATAGTAVSNSATIQWNVGPPNAAPVVFGFTDVVDEGDLNGFEFHFTDADTQDTHTATIDWGDGSPSDSYPRSDGQPGYVSENHGSGFVRGYHTYADSGIYTLTGTVTDNRGATGTAVKTANVRNIAPTLNEVTLAEVNDGITVRASFTDRGVKDTHKATINWGDGASGPVTVTEAGGSGSLSSNHAYAGPGNYTIALTLSDDDGGSASRTISFTMGSGGVGNSPPSLQLSNYQTYEGGGSFGAQFTDPDSLDVHTATIDWGDGSPAEVLFVYYGNGFGNLNGNHQYADNGMFTITVHVADNHGGVDVKSSTMTVQNAAPHVFPVGLTTSQSLFTLGEMITVSSSFNDSGVRDTHTGVWDWGDGTSTPASFTETNGSASVAESHVYTKPGAYRIRLIVTDNDGDSGVGTTFDELGFYASVISGSIRPTVRETGKVSACISGLGMTGERGVLKVEKPVGAMVRKAYLAAATTGFRRYLLHAGDIKLENVDVTWDIAGPSAIHSYNFWADVTHIVKAKLDSAPAGRVDLSLLEVPTDSIEGEVLVVIFDNPNELKDNTIALLFGAQQTSGDTFALRFAQPLNQSDPGFALTMSLGISFGHQDQFGNQYSLIDVNGHRMTTSAGGEDDGEIANGALLTVGGLDDSPQNPIDPNATPTHPRSDDELYDLKPFVNPGDTELTVITRNPSNDDNIFFAAFILQDAAVVVGEGVVLTPISASLEVGTQHTLTATAQDAQGNLLQGRDVTFEILSGPHAGLTSTVPTDSHGIAKFIYTGTRAGTDTIVCRFVGSDGTTQTSNIVTAEWGVSASAPTLLSVTPASGTYGGTTELSAHLTAGGAPLSGKDVSFSLNGATVGVAKTDPAGVATISSVGLVGINAGTYANAIVGHFAGDTNHAASNGMADLTVSKATPQLTWIKPIDIVYGTVLGKTQLTAAASVPGTFTYAPAGGTVLSAGSSQNLHVGFTPADTTNYTVASKDVSISVTNATLTVTAANSSRKYGDPNPMFSGTITGVQNNDEITASYTTAATPASGVGTYDIVPALIDQTGKLSNYDVATTKGTLIVSRAALSVVADDKSKIYGTLNPPLTVHYSGFVNGQNAGVLGGSLSLSTSATTSSAVSSYPIVASGLTSSNYAITFVNGKLMVNKAMLTVTADNKSRIYNTVNPPLTFMPSGFVNGDTGSTAFTGAPALATAAQPSSSVGAYPITASIGSLISANYSLAFVAGTLTVNRAPSITITDGKTFANNGAGILTASLLDINSVPIVNRTLTLTLGTGAGAQLCSATTDASGKASCRINTVAQPLGPGTVSGSFAGEINYLPSARSATALIFDYPTGLAGGSFVIGDVNAVVGRQVTFWGAQWANLNPLSGGAAPSSFKGFANQTSTNPANCGATWTTGPGNSAGPPSGIPTYMAVVVSSSVTKSGSTITGNVRQIVIVKTNPGYDSNPGHAGTGTVVAVWCH